MFIEVKEGIRMSKAFRWDGGNVFVSFSKLFRGYNVGLGLYIFRFKKIVFVKFFIYGRMGVVYLIRYDRGKILCFVFGFRRINEGIYR